MAAKNIFEAVKQLIPPLSHEFHKGQAGRIAIVGGSEDYTGAPFFSAISAMRLGADLCHVFCEPGAATVIKGYSPDLIVHPYLRKTEKGKEPELSTDQIIESVTSVFPRIHVLVVGPGLSRDGLMLDCAKGIIIKAKERGLPLVIDADGLFLIQNHPDLIKGYLEAVLTPNRVEFKRLCEKMNINADTSNEFQQAQQLSKAFGGVTILQKGHVDIIAGAKEAIKCDADGGLKRVGGQGDILTGLVATFLAWGKAYKDKTWEHSDTVAKEDIPMLASWAGSRIARECAHTVYQRHERAALTSDMIAEIGPSFRKIFLGGSTQ